MVTGSNARRAGHARAARLRRTLVGILTTTLAAASLVAVATPAHAVVTSGCNGFSGAVALGASYRDAGLVINACGPRPLYGGPRTPVYPYPGALSNPGYQCAEFAARYLYLKFGMTMYISTNGDQFVDHYVAKYPKQLVAVPNGTLNQAPVQGDVISFSQSSTFHASSGGHVAVVQSSSVDVNGNGTVTVIEENWSSTGQRTIPVSNWSLQLSGFPYIKWMHAPSLSNGPLDASDIATVSDSGMYTNLPIKHLWTISNGATSAVTAKSILLGVRDPNGKTYSEPCLTNVTLAAKETVFCTGARTWTVPGTYQVWPQWQDSNGYWYSGQLGQVTTFALAAGRVPDTPSAVAASIADGSVQVDWSAPLSTGGPALTGYVVTTSPSTGRLVLPTSVTTLNLAGLNPTITYKVSVRATNAIGPSDAASTMLEGSVLTMKADPAPVGYGGTVTLSGALTTPTGAPRMAAPLDLQSSTDGTTWTDVATLTTDDLGGFAYPVTLTQNTTYRVVWAGTATLRPTTPAVAAVIVKPGVTLSLLHSKSKKGQPVYFSGRYSPASGGVALLLQRKVGTTWGTIATVTTRDDGTYSGRWVPRQVGTYYLRAVRPATATLGAGVAPVRTVGIVK